MERLEPHLNDEILTALANDELTRHEERRIRRHTARCEFCRTRAALRLGAGPEELGGGRPFLFQLAQDWLNLRRFMAGLVALTMLVGVSAPLIYMALQFRQQATVDQSGSPARSDRSASASRSPVPTRRVGEKTFYLIRGVWVDSEYHPDAQRPVIPCHRSDADCQHLMEQVPQLAAGFGLGGEVIIVVEGTVYWLSSK